MSSELLETPKPSSPDAAASPATMAVDYEYTPDFPGILQHLHASLTFSTYQAGKHAVVGVRDGRLDFHFHTVDQAMGIAAGHDRLAIGGRRQVHFLNRNDEVAPSIAVDGEECRHDSAWLVRQSFHTGGICGHELAWGADGLWVVNTLFSSLCTLDAGYNFVPRWRPSFVTELDATDRCHLNGLAMADGRPRYVTAHGKSNTPSGWRADKASGGILLDVDSSEIIADGFAMPHSPRFIDGRLWVLNSGAGQLGVVDPQNGRFDVVETFPGYVRGLSFHGQFAFVGLSRIRETSVFGGLPLEEQRDNLQCGIAVVDLAAGRTVASLRFVSGVDEIFAVDVLTNTLRPFVSGPEVRSDDIQHEVWIVPSANDTASSAERPGVSAITT